MAITSGPTFRSGGSHRPVLRRSDDLEKVGADFRDYDLPAKWVWAHDAWLEVPLSDEWIAAYRFVNQDGTPVVAEVRVFPMNDGLKQRPPGQWVAEWLGIRASVPKGGIRARLLKTLKVKGPMEDFEEIASWMTKKEAGSPQIARTELGRLGWRERRMDRRAKPKSSNDEAYFARVAREYELAGKHPIKAMSERRGVPVDKVRPEVYRARELGLLTRLGQGQAGGRLTEKGLQVYRSFVAKNKRRRTRKT